jgi:hypothetical protein
MELNDIEKEICVADIKKSLKKVSKRLGFEQKNAYLYISKNNKRYEKN